MTRKEDLHVIIRGAGALIRPNGHVAAIVDTAALGATEAYLDGGGVRRVR
ncbi:hypothetical protein AB0K60_21080 [Thermopolyspora sp. NPDC052614]